MTWAAGSRTPRERNRPPTVAAEKPPRRPSTARPEKIGRAQNWKWFKKLRAGSGFEKLRVGRVGVGKAQCLKWVQKAEGWKWI